MQETRANILQLLKINSAMTVNDISECLSMTQVGVRQHLVVLERDGFVGHNRRKSDRGRPQHMYHLTDQAVEAFPKAYLNFALNLMADAEKVCGEKAIGELFQYRLTQQSIDYKNRFEAKSSPEKLCELVKIRDEEGFMADLIEDGNEYIFIEHNCPIAMIAEKYPQICDAEQQLFTESVGVEFRRKEHILRGDHNCSYRIAKKDLDSPSKAE